MGAIPVLVRQTLAHASLPHLTAGDAVPGVVLQRARTALPFTATRRCAGWRTRSSGCHLGAS